MTMVESGGVQSIICPNCGKTIRLTEALTLQLTESAKAQLEADYSQRLDAERAKIEEKAAKDAEKAKQSELHGLREELHLRTDEVDELKKQELELRRDRQDLEREKGDLELEVQRKLDEERKPIREEAGGQAEEKYLLKIADLEKKNQDVVRQLEEAQRKAAGGSPQTGGKVQEYVLADVLRDKFPDDKITPIKTGARGADVLQIARTRSGERQGSILWESKRQKNWNKGWIGKLKQDQQRENADIGAIVSAVLPFENGKLDVIEGVWVTDLPNAAHLALLLRAQLCEVCRAKAAVVSRGTLAEHVYDYVTGPFVERVKRTIEPLLKMQDDLHKERGSIERLWAQRDKGIEESFSQIAGMVGDLVGIGASLPEVKALELPSGD